jgi:hypothetical protein
MRNQGRARYVSEGGTDSATVLLAAESVSCTDWMSDAKLVTSAGARLGQSSSTPSRL